MKKSVLTRSKLCALALIVSSVAWVIPRSTDAAAKNAVKKLVITKKNISVKIGKKAKVTCKASVRGSASKKVSVKATNKSIAKITLKRKCYYLFRQKGRENKSFCHYEREKWYREANKENDYITVKKKAANSKKSKKAAFYNTCGLETSAKEVKLKVGKRHKINIFCIGSNIKFSSSNSGVANATLKNETQNYYFYRDESNENVRNATKTLTINSLKVGVTTLTLTTGTASVQIKVTVSP